jgi:hypothetical protein
MAQSWLESVSSGIKPNGGLFVHLELVLVTLLTNPNGAEKGYSAKVGTGIIKPAVRKIRGLNKVSKHRLIKIRKNPPSGSLNINFLRLILQPGQ